MIRSVYREMGDRTCGNRDTADRGVFQHEPYFTADGTAVPHRLRECLVQERGITLHRGELLWMVQQKPPEVRDRFVRGLPTGGEQQACETP